MSFKTKWISLLYKTPRLETASEFRNTRSKNMNQKCITRLTAQTMHFSIHNTERESSKCFYKFLQSFPDRELLYFQRFFCFNWWAPGRAARCHIPTYPPASPLSQIKSGAVLKKLRRRKPVIILWNEFAWKNSSKYRNVQVFALMHKMLLSEHLWCEFSILCIAFSKILYFLIL